MFTYLHGKRGTDHSRPNDPIRTADGGEAKLKTSSHGNRTNHKRPHDELRTAIFGRTKFGPVETEPLNIRV